MTNWNNNQYDAGETQPTTGFAEYDATQPTDNTYPPSDYIRPGNMNGFSDYGATVPTGNAWGSAGSGNATVANYDRQTYDDGNRGEFKESDTIPDYGGSGRNGFSDYGATVPTSWPGQGSGNTTVPGPGMEGPTGTIPVTPGGFPGFLPTVGWLICVEGPDRGRDYRIHDGYNSIGRASNMDICINGDKTISRENQATIAFDPDERKFYFAPANKKNLIKLNGKVLMHDTDLNPYDTLTIGTTKLKFVPFCGPEFGWDE